MAKYGLCIGINDYPGTGSDLSGCVNDAHDWSAALSARGFKVATLLDKQATGKAMRAAMKKVIAKGVSGDVIVIQYSGHGSFVDDLDGDEPDGRDECLCPYDIMTKGPITDDELFQIYDAKKPGVRLVVISDSCHSGSVARMAPMMGGPVRASLGPVSKVRFLPPAVFLSKKRLANLGPARVARASSPPGRYAALLMAGCQDKQYSFDAVFNNRPNGAFTFAALRRLGKLKSSATYAAWFKAIQKDLPSQDYPQAPNLFGSSSMKAWKVFS